MSAFRNLRDMCINLEKELKNDSLQLFCARNRQSYDSEIANQMQDLSLFSAKLRFLQAKTISMDGDQPEPTSEEVTIATYEDTATWKVLEQQTAKSISQFRDVRRLIATPDSELEPVLVERKKEIISKLNEYRLKEQQLRETEAALTVAEEEHSVLRAQWDEELGALRDMKDQAKSEEKPALEGPLYYKLKRLVDKMDLMRWLIGRLVTAPSQYDWLADPDSRLDALKVARKPNTMHSYTEI